MGANAMIGSFTSEDIKAGAAVVQACTSIVQAITVIIAACLVYYFNRNLEKHKTDLKLKEITVADCHKDRVATFKNISRLLGITLFDLREIHFASIKPFQRDPKDGREEFLEKYFDSRVKDYHASVLELFHACEAGYLFLPTPLYKRIEQFRMSCGTRFRSSARG